MAIDIAAVAAILETKHGLQATYEFPGYVQILTIVDGEEYRFDFGTINERWMGDVHCNDEREMELTAPFLIDGNITSEEVAEWTATTVEEYFEPSACPTCGGKTSL